MTAANGTPVELEFAGLIVQPVIQRRQNGKPIGETVNDPIPVRIFSGEEIDKLVAELEAQLAEINAATKPNRAQRRSRAK